MDIQTDPRQYSVLKGFIHGRDVGTRPIYGAFVAVGSPSGLVYHGERFSSEPIESSLNWTSLIALFGESHAEEKAEAETLGKYERELHTYIEMTRGFLGEKGPMDNKAVEKKIAYFCSDVLEMSVITFVELTPMDESELLFTMPFLRERLHKKHEAPEEKKFPEEADKPEGFPPDTPGTPDASEVFIACLPVLDPVSGVAVSNLSVGDTVYCRLPEDSAFYKLFRRSLPSFDGVVTGEVTGVQLSETGSSIVALRLSDGVSGALKISGKVRIRTLASGMFGKTAASREMSVEIALAAAGVVFFLCLLGILVYLFY